MSNVFILPNLGVSKLRG